MDALPLRQNRTWLCAVTASFRCGADDAAPLPMMSAQEIPLASQHLTKSRYIAGLQCPRRLWLLVHDPVPYEDPEPGSPMNIGQEIGRNAARRSA